MQCPVEADDAQQLCSKRAVVGICRALRRCQSARTEEKSQASEPAGWLVHRHHAGSGPQSSHARAAGDDVRSYDMRSRKRGVCGETSTESDGAAGPTIGLRDLKIRGGGVRGGLVLFGCKWQRHAAAFKPALTVP